MKTRIFIQVVAYLFVLLFLYTAFSKLLAYNVTLFDMRRNPILDDMPVFWALAVPITEILVSLLLLLPVTRFYGLLGTMILMIGFTGYVGVLLLSDFQLPCTCGGIFREMNWQQHFWVNLSLTLLAVIALILQWRKKQHNNQITGFYPG